MTKPILRNHLLLFLLLLCNSMAGSEQVTERIQLQHINTKGYMVRVVYRDVNGIVWLGTTSGLLSLPQLESHAPSSYHRIQSDENMSVRKICGDSKGRLWIKTHYNDNSLYDPRRNEYVGDVSDYLAERGVKIVSDYTVSVDEKDNLWIWKDNKLYILSEKASKPEVLSIGSDERLWTLCPRGEEMAAMSQKAIYIISKDRKIRKVADMPKGLVMRDHLFVSSNKTMWIWSKGMLWKYVDGKWVMTLQTPSDVTGVAEDSDHRLWVSSQSDGIYICNLQGDVINRMQHIPGDVYGVQSNMVEMIRYESVSKTMWIAYTKGGLSVFRGSSEMPLMHDIADRTDRNAMTDVLAFAPAKAHNGMWIGLEDRGVWLHDSQGDRNIISNGSAVSMYGSRNGDLWAGIYRRGLVNKRSDGQERIYLEGTSPFAIAENEQGTIFAALLGKGVWQIDPGSGMTRDTHIPNEYVFDLEYHEHRLYAATTVGLYVRENGQWELLCDGHYHYFCIDHNGYIWLIGNEGSEGLTLVSPQGKAVELPKDLRTAPLKSIAVDKEGNVWTVTSSELMMLRYQPKEKQPLQRYSFKINADEQILYNNHNGFVDDNGILWLGTTKGYQGIDTHSLQARTKEKASPHQIVLSAVSINDNVLSPGQLLNGRVLLEQDVIFTKELDLRYNENNLVIECSRLNSSEYITDASYYQLRGFSDVWHPFEGHTITLSNLPPGSYELYTRTQSSEESLLLRIHIAPPMWLTWWAFCLYALFVAGVAYGLVRHYRNRRAYAQKLRELQVEQEQQTQMNELKLRFFTNISHDLRTPLSLIIGPVEEMMNSERLDEGDLRTSLGMVHRNAQHLLSLVNQILDMRRLEFGREKLVLNYGDIVSFIYDIFGAFRLKAEKEQMDFKFKATVERVETMFDRDKTSKIMMNLLSNAFKFTPAGGSIHITLNVSDGNIVIAVADSGEGIADADKPHVFDRFYKSDNNNRVTMGSGIGLHIVREYVRLQNGDISVSDNTEDGKGTVFSFNIPLKKNDEQHDQEADADDTMIQNADSSAAGSEDNEEEAADKRPLVLLVDDNSDLLEYMSMSLGNDFRVATAANGVEALPILQQQDIDIMVSDVMMPQMDGLELCHHVKHNIETSHILIVMLTAKTMTSDELRGLEAGADDYITKPFSMDILRQRLHNLVERSRHSHERFAKEVDVAPSEITITSLDEQFIARAISVVEVHISEPDYSIEQLSEELGLHRAQLYKKLMHLTGKSPQQFMRILRLKRGKQLLEQSGLYVSEVAYRVGFNSPRIFSKYFKQEFGITPKDYANSEG